MELDYKFWKNKRVLISGHTGFKGSWLTLWLKQLGAEVIGYSLEPPTSPSLFIEADVSDGITSIQGDILDFDSFNNTIQAYQPEFIFHLAAQSLVKNSYIDPMKTFSTNIIGTVNMLEAARQTKSVRVIINVTSDKCYENQENPFWGYREIDPMGGYDPYSASKGCAELVTNSYRKSFFNSESNVKLASVRAGNVIGGGDWAENRLIPDIIRAVKSNSSLIIRNPYAVRPWQHVLEPLNGYLLLAEKIFNHGHEYAEGWNFGPKDDGIITVKELLTSFEKEWGRKINILYCEQPYHEAYFLKLDCSKAFHKLNWLPKLSLKDTFNWTVTWYKEYLAGSNMRELSLKQIGDYMKI